MSVRALRRQAARNKAKKAGREAPTPEALVHGRDGRDIPTIEIRTIGGRPVHTARAAVRIIPGQNMPDMPTDGGTFPMRAIIASENDVWRVVYESYGEVFEYLERISLDGIDLTGERWPLPIGMNHYQDVNDHIANFRDPEIIVVDGVRCLAGTLDVDSTHPKAGSVRNGTMCNLSIDYVAEQARDITGQPGTDDAITTLLVTRTALLGACFVLFPADGYSTTIRAAFDARHVEGGMRMAGFRGRRGDQQPNGTGGAPAPQGQGQGGGNAPGAGADPNTEAGDGEDGDGDEDEDEDELSDAEATEIEQAAANDADIITRCAAAGISRSFYARYIGRRGADIVTADQVIVNHHNAQVRTARGERGGRAAVVVQDASADYGLGNPNHRSHGRFQLLSRAAAATSLNQHLERSDPASQFMQLNGGMGVGPVDLYREVCDAYGITGQRALRNDGDIFNHMRGLSQTARSVAPSVMADFNLVVEQTAQQVVVSQNDRNPFVAADFMQRIDVNTWRTGSLVIATSVDPLEELVEGQEIPVGGMSVFDDDYRLIGMGKRYYMSRQMIETNSAGLFTNFASNVYEAANIARNNLVVDGIRRNKTMSKDGIKFFHYKRQNVGQNLPLNNDSLEKVVPQLAGNDPTLLTAQMVLVVNMADFPAAQRLNAAAPANAPVNTYAGMFKIVVWNGLPKGAWMIMLDPNRYGSLINLERDGQPVPMIHMFEPEAYDAMGAKVLYDRGFAYGNPYKIFLAFAGKAPTELLLTNQRDKVDPAYGLPADGTGLRAAA